MFLNTCAPKSHRHPVLITTSIIRGSSAERIANEFSNIYGSPLNLLPEGNFFPVPTTDLRFGYWGSSDTLGKIENAIATKTLSPKNRLTNPDFLEKLFHNDKTLRFLPLPPTTWRTAITLSPAEPGLSAVSALPEGTLPGPGFSAGGWSDLHPTLVLNMLPECEQVVYLTRKGNDSEFATNIRARLLGKEIEGRSILDISVEAADQVICTDWNDFQVTTQLKNLIENSYRAKILNPRDHQTQQSRVAGMKRIPGCTP